MSGEGDPMADEVLARGLAVQRQLLRDDDAWQAACKAEHDAVRVHTLSRLLDGRAPLAVAVGLVYELGVLVGRVAAEGGPVEGQVRKALEEALALGRAERQRERVS